MNIPQLSVIIPVYNAEKYIADILSGLMAQTFTDFEVICVDDCSKDNSLAVLQAQAQKDKRIRCIALEQNVGAGRARNVGIREAKGTYITFLDADDSIEKDLYERAMALTEGGLVDQVVWGAVEEHYNSADQHIRSVPIIPRPCDCRTQEEILKTVLQLEQQTLFGYLWNSLYRAAIIKENAIEMSAALFYEDYFFNLDFIRQTKRMRVLDYGGYHYFKRVNASVTHRFSKDYFDLSYDRVRSLHDYCLEKEMLTPEARQILGNKLLRYTLSALARNNHPLARMDQKARRNWIGENLSRPLYAQLLTERFPTNPVFGALRWMILRKWEGLLLLAGKTVYVVRR